MIRYTLSAFDTHRNKKTHVWYALAGFNIRMRPQQSSAHVYYKTWKISLNPHTSRIWCGEELIRKPASGCICWLRRATHAAAQQNSSSFLLTLIFLILLHLSRRVRAQAVDWKENKVCNNNDNAKGCAIIHKSHSAYKIYRKIKLKRWLELMYFPPGVLYKRARGPLRNTHNTKHIQPVPAFLKVSKRHGISTRSSSTQLFQDHLNFPTTNKSFVHKFIS